MRLTVLANADIESNIALNLLLRAFPGEISHIFLSEQVGKPGARQPAALAELKYIEQTFFRDIFFPLIEQEPIRPGRFLSFQQICDHHLIPVTRLNEINSPAGHQSLLAARPDLILSIRYGKILQFNAIRTPRLGVLNLHSGLLPDYRGVLATFRALLNGDAEIGATLHYITDPGIDRGDIIDCRRIPVAAEKSLFWHIVELYFAAVPLMVEVVRKIQQGLPVNQHLQDPAAGHYYSFPDEADFEDFHAKGWRLADPTDIERIARYYL